MPAVGRLWPSDDDDNGDGGTDDGDGGDDDGDDEQASRDEEHQALLHPTVVSQTVRQTLD